MPALALIQSNSSAAPGTVSLPASKSESNRALMIRAYSGNLLNIRNLSDAADTETLAELLEGVRRNYNAKDAGTTFRFLTSYLAFSKKESTLTGSDRMKQRPIRLLVDALSTLGCQIQYLEKEGYPPLHFKPFEWSGKSEVSIDATISSQYISSLMMAAPTLPDGLNIHLLNEVASLPYLRMTWALMQQAGIKGEFSNGNIRIPHQQYKPDKLQIESDWSAASYFYGMVALSEKPMPLFLSGLTENSLQGDAVIQQIAREWGIETRFEKEGVWIERISEIKPAKLVLDCLGFPDLGQTLIVMCALSGKEAELSGLQSLAIKETNRLLAMKTELAKISVFIEINESKGICLIPGNQNPQIQNPIFETYEDHRMAMALSMIGATNSNVSIREPGVVRKSFPGFWAAMEKCGFICTLSESK
ncbi:MAG TPA: 3-phosphoshikimate 1-carboxyvinyltransferase [Catalimonadaceae bacterium]|nr:3-phosphoshikimate 1-carboxyvinyltransferase [Catalimonadaceae bacterium]HPI10713.1 3-phosphoshikimate 1-carboxyvinyltransferase [Catalimonadaceae bacterium]